jgi:cell shape-determining protein MreD
MNKTNFSILLFILAIFLLVFLRPSFLNGNFLFFYYEPFLVALFFFNFLFPSPIILLLSFLTGLIYGFFSLYSPLVMAVLFILIAFLAQKIGSLMHKNNFFSFLLSFFCVYFLFYLGEYLLVLINSFINNTEQARYLFYWQTAIKGFLPTFLLVFVFYLIFGKNKKYERQAIF